MLEAGKFGLLMFLGIEMRGERKRNGVPKAFENRGRRIQQEYLCLRCNFLNKLRNLDEDKNSAE